MQHVAFYRHRVCMYIENKTQWANGKHVPNNIIYKGGNKCCLVGSCDYTILYNIHRTEQHSGIYCLCVYVYTYIQTQN